MSKVTLGDLIGSSLEDDFLNFDLTEIQSILSSLSGASAHDLAHAELFQQQALRCADILSEYLGRMIKTVSYLEGKANSAKNRAALDYKDPSGAKVTADMRKNASESDPEVDKILEKLAKAKGSKSVLEKKYDILIRTHHFYKEIASGYKRSILPVSNAVSSVDWSPMTDSSLKEQRPPADGWEG